MNTVFNPSILINEFHNRCQNDRFVDIELIDALRKRKMKGKEGLTPIYVKTFLEESALFFYRKRKEKDLPCSFSVIGKAKFSNGFTLISEWWIRANDVASIILYPSKRENDTVTHIVFDDDKEE